jgi:hypothetical protein
MFLNRGPSSTCHRNQQAVAQLIVKRVKATAFISHDCLPLGPRNNFRINPPPSSSRRRRHRKWHKALAIPHGSKPLNLLGQTRHGPKRPRSRSALDDLPLELRIELLDEVFPAHLGLAVDQVGQDPAPLRLHVRVHDVAEAHARVAADLLHGALVEGRDGFLVVPVARRRVREDALAACVVEQFDDELGFLVGHAAVGEELEAAGDELRAVKVGISAGFAGGSGGVRLTTRARW